jgi:DNA-binding CsgD family transcriptional regulator
MVSVVEEQLESLSPRQALVLRMRYGIGCEEHTYEEIGDKFDLTKERIRQIEAKALRHLKHPSRSDTLRQLLPTYERNPDPEQKTKVPACGNVYHLFYTNPNQVSVCAYCGVGEDRLNKIEEHVRPMKEAL